MPHDVLDLGRSAARMPHEPRQKHSTGGSRVIPQHSTNPAQTSLTSEIGRDRVLSGWYDRAMHQQVL